MTHGETARAGQIIIRQRGVRVLAGTNVRRGADDTLYAAVGGVVSYRQTKKIKFDGVRRYAKEVSVVPTR